MGYNIDLCKMDIQEYKKILKNQYLIPSRQILHEHIDENFIVFEKCDFKNLFDLKQALSTSAKIDKLSKETRISSEYLNILRRELGTFDKKGILFKNFPVINTNIIKSLEKNGIKNTKDFYEYYFKEKMKKLYQAS